MKSKFIGKSRECDRVAIILSSCVDYLKNMAAYGIQMVLFEEKYENCDYNIVEKIAELYKIKLYHRAFLNI